MNSTEDTILEQREIQKRQDEKDRSKSDDNSSQSKSSKYPDSFPAQHLQKPGLESDLEPRPSFKASEYKGSEKLRGKVALISGADSGIGRAVAVLYAREGADVAIVYLHADSDAEETRTYVEKEGQQCLLIRGDVKEASFCEKAVSQVIDKFGKLDILVNNAAFQEHADSLLDLDVERFDETFKTNVYGYFNLTRAALPQLKSGAAIINTGSVTGLKGSSHLLDYSTTKGAIHAFTKALAQNLVEKGIRVNAVAPGPVWTPLNPADASAEKIKSFGTKTDIGRAAQPEEISPAYVFLAASACSSYITGIVLPITGSVGAI